MQMLFVAEDIKPSRGGGNLVTGLSDEKFNYKGWCHHTPCRDERRNPLRGTSGGRSILFSWTVLQDFLALRSFEWV